jgi:hypothetical protein
VSGCGGTGGVGNSGPGFGSGVANGGGLVFTSAGVLLGSISGVEGTCGTSRGLLPGSLTTNRAERRVGLLCKIGL